MGPPAPVGEARGRVTASGSAAGEGDIQALVRNAAMATVCNLDGDGPSAPDAVRHDDGGEGESAKDSSHLDRVGAQFDGGGAGLDGPGDGCPLAAWPGGVISPRRDMAPITALVRSVRSWARSPAIPVCADGSAGYVTAFGSDGRAACSTSRARGPLRPAVRGASGGHRPRGRTAPRAERLLPAGLDLLPPAPDRDGHPSLPRHVAIGHPPRRGRGQEDRYHPSHN
jgi:hypothetical protein